jgi:hypothetical protein
VIAQYNNIGSEVLRLQDYAQIILKFSLFISWTDISRASGILKGPVAQKFYWPYGPVIIFFLSRPLIWYRHPTKENTKVRPEMTKFKMFREKVNMDFYFVGITF